MATTLYLVRHAQANPLRAVPEPEWELSERGQAQAAGLVPVLTALGIEAVYSSPFRRSIDTLRPFTTARELPLQVRDGLRERCLSRDWIADLRDVWQRSWADLSYALEGGESGLVCRSRMAGAVRAIAEDNPEGTVALGSHGYAIALLLTTLDPSFGVREASALRTPEIVRLRWDKNVLTWDREFEPGAEFDALATDFRLTPGIVA